VEDRDGYWRSRRSGAGPELAFRVALLGMAFEQMKVELPVSFKLLATVEGAIEARPSRCLVEVIRIGTTGWVVDRQFENLCHNC
jgi:hypothetical protein